MQRAENDCPRWGQAGEVRPQAGEVWLARRGEDLVELRVTDPSANGYMFGGRFEREATTAQVAASMLVRRLR